MYHYNMPELDKEIRRAVVEAKRAGLKLTRHTGHTWGRLTCTNCGQRIPIYSSGKAPDKGAKLIRRFTAKHQH